MKEFDELRVVDLRAELEKRGMDKTGIKATLIERLRKAVLDEGVNPEDTEFDTTTPMKQNNNSVTSEDDNYTNGTEAEEKEDTQDNGNDEICAELTEDAKMDLTSSEVSPSPLKESMSNTINDISQASDGIQKNSLEEEEFTEAANEKAPAKSEDIMDQTDEDLMGEITMQDDSIDLLLEDEDKLLDYEESDRVDMDDNTEDRDKGKADNEESISLDNELNSSDTLKEDSVQKADEEKSTCNLWVSGLRQSTKAQDLRTIFLKHGKVLSVKIVTNAKSTTGRCFGFITMANKEAAQNCISNLHQTEVNGRIILVELAKGDLGGSAKAAIKTDNKEGTSILTTGHQENEENKKDGNSDKNDRSITEEKAKSSRSRSKSGNRETRVSAKDRVVDRRNNKTKNNFRSRSPRKDVLNLRKIESERVKQRQRTRERLMREEERRRRDEYVDSRNLEKRQREEGLKLQKEREKLKLERERLDRQKQELVRIEREQQKLERERIQREREEIRRQALKYEEVRRGLKRSPSDRDREFYDQNQRKRPDNRSRFETTNPPPTSSSHRENRFERPGRTVESRSSGGHYDERRGRAEERRHPVGRGHRDMPSSTHQTFRGRQPRDSRFGTESISQSSVTETWRPTGSHATKGYGSTSNVSIPNQGPAIGRTGSEPQGGWRSSSNLSGDRWTSSTNVTSRSGQTLLEMMHRGSEQHHVPQVQINSHDTNMPLISNMQHRDRFPSINYRNY